MLSHRSSIQFGDGPIRRRPPTKPIGLNGTCGEDCVASKVVAGAGWLSALWRFDRRPAFRGDDGHARQSTPFAGRRRRRVTNWVVAVVGSLLVAVVVRDVFHTLFHPIGHGSIAPQVMKFVWWLLRLFPSDRRIASLTGPLGIALVVLTWGAIAVTGWALLYFAQMPDGFAYGSELNPAGRNNMFDSLYISLVTIGTLGFGDIVPTSPFLRVIVPLEALFGFMLLTAAVSWVLQIYPALHRRRVLALQLSTLREARRAEPTVGIDGV